MNIIMIGMAGSGKGTQAKRLAAEFGMKHLSAGDALREEAKEDTDTGRQIREIQKEGKLAPIKIILDAMKPRMGENNIFDGFPRNLEQAEALDEISEINLVINLEIPDEVAIERLGKRRQCKECGAITDDSQQKCPKCGGELYQREDDEPVAIKKRLNVYHDVTEPLLEYYRPRDIVKTVDGTKTPDEIFEELRKIVEEVQHAN